ncbi:hypothetical protein BVX98_02200, partial [bacterium F11]
INAIEVIGDSVLIGGNFEKVNGRDRKFLAKLDISDGTLKDWDPRPDKDIWGLFYDGSHLYVTGSFKEISSEERIYVAAYDKDYQITPFHPALANGHQQIVKKDSSLYFGVGGGVYAVDLTDQWTYRYQAVRLKNFMTDIYYLAVKNRVNKIIVKDSSIFIGGNLEWRYGKGTYSVGVAEYKLLDAWDGLVGEPPRNIIDGNQPPVAKNQTKHIYTGDPVPITLTAEDPDTPKDDLTFSVVSLPSHGALYGEEPELIYHPPMDYYGVVRFTFKVSDGLAESEEGMVTFVIDTPPSNGTPPPPPIGTEPGEKEDRVSRVVYLNENKPAWFPCEGTVSIFNQVGKVKELSCTELINGKSHATWRGRNSSGQVVAAGTYIVQKQNGKAFNVVVMK